MKAELGVRRDTAAHPPLAVLIRSREYPIADDDRAEAGQSRH